MITKFKIEHDIISAKSEFCAIFSGDPEIRRSQKAENKRIQKKVSDLQYCLAYLESNPMLEFLEKEKQRLEKINSEMLSNYQIFREKNSHLKNEDKTLSEFIKSIGAENIKLQLWAINYIIGG